ncbi:hypothetical protein Taro_016282 [Colocasia esculenta]|uniref:Uncharacterized protein n=1 Tax=Colocasia esculenta TaxID=4460 RepID=A0A843UK89_COLES|nr:hypothetical protein [Colocasia esculenta]
MAVQGFTECQSIFQPPLFDGEDYQYCKTMMEFFLQGYAYQIWSIIEDGDLQIFKPKEEWTTEEKKKISLNSKAKSFMCCALIKQEFNRISTCKTVKDMWEMLRLTYEGTVKVKETRIDIMVTQYEKFKMKQGEFISQMYNEFTEIINGLASLGKKYSQGDMVRKILRSLSKQWIPKVTAIEEANDLSTMTLEKLIGSLMAHKINMERLGESSFRRRPNNTFKAEESTSDEATVSECSDSKDEGIISKSIRKILERRKEKKKMKRKDEKYKEYKRKTFTATWENSSDNSSTEEEVNANLLLRNKAKRHSNGLRLRSSIELFILAWSRGTTSILFNRVFLFFSEEKIKHLPIYLELDLEDSGPSFCVQKCSSSAEREGLLCKRTELEVCTSELLLNSEKKHLAEVKQWAAFLFEKRRRPAEG